MDWSAVGALGEVLGALAVVLTLGYLAKQVRQSNRIAKAEAFRSARVRQANLAESWAHDKEWAELFIRIRWQGLRRGDLTLEERAVAGMRYLSALHLLAAAYEDVQLGILPSSAYKMLGTDTFTVPYMRDVWPILRGEHSSEFVEFFETRFGLRDVTDSVERIPPGARTPPLSSEGGMS